MAIQTISTLPDAPVPSDSPEEFAAKAAAFVPAMSVFGDELNQFAIDLLAETALELGSTVSNTQALISGSGFDEGECILSLGYSESGDGGQCLWVKTSSTDTVSQSPAQRVDGSLTDAEGFIWNLVDYKVNASMFGANETDDAIGALEAAANYLSDKSNILGVDKDISATDDVTKVSDLTFVGSGSLSGVYRKQVIPENAPTARAMPDSAFYTTPTKEDVIVLVGDSLSTYSADSLTAADTLAITLQEKLSEAAGVDLSDNFYSRGIGATTLAQLDGKPATDPSIRYPWYDDYSVDWLDYVAALNPTIVIVSMGMNDKQNFSRPAFESVLDKIYAMGATPIFITNMVPTLSESPYSDTEDQEGRDHVAGYIRSYCRFNKISLIDINRTFNIMRDGRDIMETYFQETDDYTLSGGVLSLNDTSLSRGVCYRVSFEENAFDSTVALSVGTLSTNSVFITDENGFLKFQFFTGITNTEQNTKYNEIISDIATETAAQDYEITVKDGLFTFRVDYEKAGARAGTKPVTSALIHGGGIHSFRFIAPITSATVNIAKEKLYKPAITDSGVFMRYSGVGNDVNHPNSKGCSYIYGEHFKSQDYSGIKLIDTVTIGDVVARKYSDGSLVTSAELNLGLCNNSEGAIYTTSSASVAFPIEYKEVTGSYGRAYNTNSMSQTLCWLTFGNSGTNVSINSAAKSAVSISYDIGAKVEFTGKWR